MWIVNLPESKIEVYSDPSPTGYRQRHDYSADEAVPLVLEDRDVAKIPVADPPALNGSSRLRNSRHASTGTMFPCSPCTRLFCIPWPSVCSNLISDGHVRLCLTQSLLTLSRHNLYRRRGPPL